MAKAIPGKKDKSGKPKKGLRSRGLTTIDTDTKYTKKKQK